MVDSRKRRPDLLTELLSRWPEQVSGQSAIEVGLSGGMDSMVLLDLLWRCREQRHFHLSALHVHHGLSRHADDWVRHCQHWCDLRAIPLRVERVTVAPRGGQSLEAVARDERYAAFCRTEAQVVALAHHQDDQAETVLLQLLRGGGPRALAAMPVLRQLNQLYLWRPMLDWPRSRIEAYAVSRSLTWVTDESNADTRWRRNLLRHDVLPLIESALPDYRRHLERSAAMMWQAAQILDEVATQDLAECLNAGRLQLIAFSGKSDARQAQMLQHWIKSLSLGEATPQAIDDFCRQLLHAPPDKNPELQLARAVLFRYRDQVWVEPAAPGLNPQAQWLSGAEGCHDLPGWGGQLSLQTGPQGIATALLLAGVELRPRSGGERLALAVGRKPVKTLLQEAGIPPRLRARWPLLYLMDGRLAAVPSVAVAHDCRAPDGLWPAWLARA